MTEPTPYELQLLQSRANEIYQEKAITIAEAWFKAVTELMAKKGLLK